MADIEVLGALGRPKDTRKRAAIIAAARHLFFQHGVEAVSIETIAADAGVSKVTVYGHFGDKETLFEAMVRNEAARIENTLEEIRHRHASPSDTLLHIGVTLLTFLLTPEQQAFSALIAQEAKRHSNLARRFFDAGPAYIKGRIAAAILGLHDAGQIVVEEPLDAAEDLIALWQGSMPLEIRLGMRSKPDHAEIMARVTRGLELFFKAYAKP